ncbi:MAG: SpoIIE family protein phosphatase [Rhodobacteraceae bacterium]|nr:SpoIIE family protein phosphatase [Paracoccaceae bacterium]
MNAIKAQKEDTKGRQLSNDGVYNVLVVDDEPDLKPLVLQRMRQEIRNRQYTFQFAANGIEALDILKEDRTIHIVLADINMPKMDGITLLQQIPMVNHRIRSVVVSAYGDIRNIRKAMNAGAFDFITKPIDFLDLKSTLERTISHIEMWRDIGSRDVLSSIDNNIGIASRMQMAVLPRRFPQGSGYKLAGTMEPLEGVGGDFYDVFVLEDGLLGLAIADISDCGVRAAIFMMTSRSLFKGAAIGARTPRAVLQEVNRRLAENNEEGMFVTIFYCIFDPFSGRVVYSNAGHCNPLLIRAGGSHEFLTSRGGGALGMADIVEFEDQKIMLNSGDHLILYTDGVTMTQNEAGEVLGEEGLVNIARDVVSGASATPDEDIIDAVKGFSGASGPPDDITCLVLRFDNTMS